MFSGAKIAFIPAAATLFWMASPHARADAPTLPTFGHFIGYVNVASPTKACPDKSGDHFIVQLELNTVKEIPVFLTRFVDYGGAGGAPVLFKVVYNRKSGPKRAPSGTLTLTNEITNTSVNGTYSAFYTPIDPNSFAGALHLTYSTSAGICKVKHEVVFVRSSAD